MPSGTIAALWRTLAVFTFLPILILTGPVGVAQTRPDPERLIGRIDPAELAVPEGVVAAMVRNYIADYGNLDRFHTAPFSSNRALRFRQLIGEWLGELGRLNYDSLTLAGRVDYLLFRNHLNHELEQVRTGESRFAEMKPLLPFADALIGLEDDRRMLKSPDPVRVASLLDTLVREINTTRQRLDAAAAAQVKSGDVIVEKTVANRAFRAVGDLREMLGRWFGYYSGYDPVFSWWVEAPFRSLDTALARYGDFLRDRLVGVRSDDATTIIGDPIGREALLSELTYEMIPYTPEELLRIAEREMAWCRVEMLRASQELGFGDDWRKALEHVKTLHAGPGEQPELIRDLALEAVRFLEERDLLTVPVLAKETWRMEMMSPERQKIAPFFLGGEVIQVSFPTNTMSHEEKMMSMRGNNRHFARATVHHELIPGHHLQGFMSSRYRTYRRIFGTPFWTEGWALYWELLLWEKNFAQSPEDRVGMLFWRMHRCARIIFSLSFHMEKMTPSRCVDYLVDSVGHERENALAEVRRSFAGDYGPLYQAAYLLGGLQLRSLHRELVESGGMSDREFHDTILRNNTMPVEMVRAVLTGRDPGKEFTPEWRFYGNP